MTSGCPDDPDPLLAACRQLEAMSPLHGHPRLDGPRRGFLAEVRADVARPLPSRIAALAGAHGWAESFGPQMAAWHRFLDAGPAAGVMTPAEMRRNAPCYQDVLDAIEARPEVVAKIGQGFTLPVLVPFGLSPEALARPVAEALRECHRRGELCSTDGAPLTLDVARPVWAWSAYAGADAAGAIVYEPNRLRPDGHGGKSKRQVLAGSRHPGWQVLLCDPAPAGPRSGEGLIVGGRPQFEAGRTPHEYLEALQTGPAYAHEQGLTPEAWLANFLAHLTRTGGEVLDDYARGSTSWLTGAYVPAAGCVPCAYWDRYDNWVALDGGGPALRNPYDGARSAVRVM